MRYVAVDWSGRRRGAAEFIWIAEVVEGTLVRLENGRSREAVVDWLLEAAASDPELVAGLDFAFSFPAWYCRERGWSSAAEVWRAIADEGEALLAEQPDPFWGRAKRRPQTLAPERRLRHGEAALGAKSVLQIGGSGAVGTGSIRGMPCLLALREAGFAVWPFDGAGPPAVLEIYPRALYPAPVVKSDRRARERLLTAHFAGTLGDLSRCAASTEDAFDAAVSALTMARLTPTLPALAPDDAVGRLEGRIWTPPPPSTRQLGI